MKFIVAPFIGAALSLTAAAQAKDSIPIETILQPKRVCAISDVIAIGVSKDQPGYMTLATVEARDTPDGPAWRASHAAVDGAEIAAAHDVMDVLRKSMRPISSEYNGGDAHTAFIFDHKAKTATKQADGAMPAEIIPLGDTFVVPEGPGTHVLYQAVPWKNGLRLRANQVDRWRGSGAGRLVPLTISVEGNTLFAVDGQSLAVWKVRSVPDNGSYAIEEWVTKSRPHRVVRTSYSASANATPMISEVRSFKNGADCV